MMPIFEYRCNKCGNEFEEIRSVKDDSPITCPSCKGTDVKKKVSTFGSGKIGDGNSACSGSSRFT
jgi:putative FmdB family regulatory protein